jgi:hypothetical protein
MFDGIDLSVEDKKLNLHRSSLGQITVDRQLLKGTSLFSFKAAHYVKAKTKRYQRTSFHQ